MIMTWTKWMEKRISSSNFLIRLYEKYYKKIVRNEIKLAEVKSSDKILCIGGGSIPCTALQMVNLTGAKVDVIDVDNRAVYNARNVVDKMGLNNKIYIINARGEETDISSYDVIHVALQVTPKEEVVEHIWSKARKGTRILVRMPKKNLRCFYSNISDKYLNEKENCSSNCCLNNGLNTMKEVLLMIKK